MLARLTLRWLRIAAICFLPMLAGLWVGSTTFGGSEFKPWKPQMVDLDVYRRVGEMVIGSGDIYNSPDRLPFLYPPFAALLAVLLAVLPVTVMQWTWVGINVLCVLAMLYRAGLKGWVLSLVSAAVILGVEPVAMTFAFGQLGIVLVALVCLDVMPGPHFLARWRSAHHRIVPEGVFSGIATAIKLTPGITMLYLLAARRRRPGLMVGLSFLAATLVAAVALPRESLTFWGRLAHGDTGLGGSVIYVTNQSVMGTWLRLVGLGQLQSLTGLAACAVVAGLGVWAAALWHRLGWIQLGVCLSGVAGLLASPVSWSHHFVWVVPLAVVLMHKLLPVWVRISGYLFCGWVAFAPFKKLPGGADVELTYTAEQLFLDSLTTVLGIAFLVICIVAGQRARARHGSADISVDERTPLSTPATQRAL